MRTLFPARRIILAFVLFSTTSLLSCTTLEPLTSVVEIRGKQWRLQAFDPPEGERVTLSANAPEYSFRFSDSTNRVSGKWNCNILFSGILVLQAPNTLRLDSISTTFRGCENTEFDKKMRSGDGRQSLEGWLFDRNNTYNSDENRLRIWYDNNTKSADFVRVP
jgi:heat shock protein HslJ